MLRSQNLAYSSTDRQRTENDIYIENNIYTESKSNLWLGEPGRVAWLCASYSGVNLMMASI